MFRKNTIRNLLILFEFYFVIIFRSSTDNRDEPKSPVCEWWRDLHAWCEPECMTYLQSKPILNHSLNKDGASSTSGLSTNTSGSSILSNNSLNSSNKSSLSSNASYLNYDASNLASLKAIRKLQNGANEIFATFESMSKYVIMIIITFKYFLASSCDQIIFALLLIYYLIIYFFVQPFLVASMMLVWSVEQIKLVITLAKVSTFYSVRFKNTFSSLI